MWNLPYEKLIRAIIPILLEVDNDNKKELVTQQEQKRDQQERMNY
jgi:hypothetical protein